eukprot:144903-Chlamydomonas_euryale.AAC.1
MKQVAGRGQEAKTASTYAKASGWASPGGQYCFHPCQCSSINTCMPGKHALAQERMPCTPLLRGRVPCKRRRSGGGSRVCRRSRGACHARPLSILHAPSSRVILSSKLP